MLLYLLIFVVISLLYISEGFSNPFHIDDDSCAYKVDYKPTIYDEAKKEYLNVNDFYRLGYNSIIELAEYKYPDICKI